MDVLYKWNHTIGGLSCLAYSTWHHVFEVRPRRSTYRYFIPFCGSILFHRTDRPHFVYPAVARRVRCFHLPAVVNSAAVNIHGQVCVWKPVSTSWGHIPTDGIESSANDV